MFDYRFFSLLLGFHQLKKLKERVYFIVRLLDVRDLMSFVSPLFYHSCLKKFKFLIFNRLPNVKLFTLNQWVESSILSQVTKVKYF